MSGGEAPRLCSEQGCDNELAASQRYFCSKVHGNSYRQREWRHRKELRRAVEACSIRNDDGLLVHPEATKELIASVVDRASYIRALEECEAQRRAQAEYLAKRPRPYTMLGLGRYGENFSRRIEAGVLIGREVCEARHEDEIRTSRWARKAVRFVPEWDGKQADYEPHHEKAHPIDSAHGWHDATVVIRHATSLAEHECDDDATRRDRSSTASRKRFARHWSLAAMEGRFRGRLASLHEARYFVDGAAGSPASELDAQRDVRIDLPPLSCCDKPGHVGRHNGRAHVPRDWNVQAGEQMPQKLARRLARRRANLYALVTRHKCLIAGLKRVLHRGDVVIWRNGRTAIVNVRRNTLRALENALDLGQAKPEATCRQCQRFDRDCVVLARCAFGDSIPTTEPESESTIKFRVVISEKADDECHTVGTSSESVTA